MSDSTGDIQTSSLARAVRARRVTKGLSLRAAAKEIGISFATLDRIENGGNPYLPSLERVCAWLGQPVTRYTMAPVPVDGSSIERVVDLLASDPELPPDSAHLLARLVSDLHKALRRPTTTRELT